MHLMEPDQVKRIVEAALLAAGQPLSLAQLTALFGEGETVAREGVAQALESLAAECEGRGIELVEIASGFRYQIRADVHPWVARMWTERQTRYSRALLETLALIAYRQPITRAEIEQIRGVAVSASIIRTLEEREWVRVVGHRDVPGKPALFGTTRQFLDYFSLKSLDELPPLAEIRDLEDLEPQLALGDEAHAGLVPQLAPVTEAGEASTSMTDEITEPAAADAGPVDDIDIAALADAASTFEAADVATNVTEAPVADATAHEPADPIADPDTDISTPDHPPPADVPDTTMGDDANRATPENTP
jgi:segregation and condensation protein B